MFWILEPFTKFDKTELKCNQTVISMQIPERPEAYDRVLPSTTAF